MELLIGFAMAVIVCVAATIAGLDRDRAFYPTIMVVISSYYALFAILGGSILVLIVELLISGVFALISIAGFRKNLWILVAALVAHGLFDLVHGHVVTNPGVPGWWPLFCFAYDFVAAVYLAWLMKSRRVRSTAI